MEITSKRNQRDYARVQKIFKFAVLKRLRILFIVVITIMYMRNRDENESTGVSQMNLETSYRKDFIKEKILRFKRVYLMHKHNSKVTTLCGLSRTNTYEKILSGNILI